VTAEAVTPTAREHRCEHHPDLGSVRSERESPAA
jgi:hypothetical protein